MLKCANCGNPMKIVSDIDYPTGTVTSVMPCNCATIDLLKACKVAYNAMVMTDSEWGDIIGSMEPELSQVKDAIAKAKGNS